MPAYGKQYNSVEEVQKAWEDNQDFKIVGGPYLNKRDWEKYGNALDSLHYNFADVRVTLVPGILS